MRPLVFSGMEYLKMCPETSLPLNSIIFSEWFYNLTIAYICVAFRMEERSCCAWRAQPAKSNQSNEERTKTNNGEYQNGNGNGSGSVRNAYYVKCAQYPIRLAVLIGRCESVDETRCGNICFWERRLALKKHSSRFVRQSVSQVDPCTFFNFESKTNHSYRILPLDSCLLKRSRWAHCAFIMRPFLLSALGCVLQHVNALLPITNYLSPVSCWPSCFVDVTAPKMIAIYHIAMCHAKPNRCPTNKQMAENMQI